MLRSPARESAEGHQGLNGPPRRFSGSGLFGLGWSLAAALTVASVYLASSPPSAGPIGPTSRIVVWVLGVNLALILTLSAAAGQRVLKLVFLRARDAGARLHLRFVFLFASVAVVPAIIVAMVFGALVTRSVDSWFSQRVQDVLENSDKVDHTYVEDQNAYIVLHMVQMANDVNDIATTLKVAPISFSRALDKLASFHAFPAAYLIDADGRILARSAGGPAAPPFMAPPPATLRLAAHDIVAEQFESQDLFRAVYRLRAYPDAYLYVARFTHPGALGLVRRAEASLADYREADRSHRSIQAAFALSYLETTLLVLVGAVWVGMSAASSIAAPVARLVHAADRVAGGDLDARVEIGRDPEEIAVLSRAFNRMTSDLQDQQKALRRANADAESRRQFIETVLAEVSAGVIGLDGQGRISAANRRALALLGLDAQQAYGRPLHEAAPELAEVALRAAHDNQDAGHEIDIVRGSETLRLRVRASGRDDEGLVLTFDDITRLVAAQRNAAWRDVARRIAHEIKNPLTPIQLSAERLRRKYRREITVDVETFDRCTDTIIRQVEDIGRMVDEFSAFARMPAPRFEETDARELLRQSVFARRVASPDITVEMDEPAPEGLIFADSRMVGQALTNVLKNAAEAIAARRLSDPDVAGRLTARLVSDGVQVAFEVEDNGIGLPAKDRDRLTEPYVTTREKGTGLGLAIVKRIMEEHGGALVMQDAASLPGAKVILRFPPLRKSEEAAPQGAAVVKV
jgi:two-component system nitrogen regulation sensor histidine kinase NtrY